MKKHNAKRPISMSANLDSIGEDSDFENVSNPSRENPDPASESMINSSPEARSLPSGSLSSIKFNHTLNSDAALIRSSPERGNEGDEILKLGQINMVSMYEMEKINNVRQLRNGRAMSAAPANPHPVVNFGHGKRSNLKQKVSQLQKRRNASVAIINIQEHNALMEK